MACNHCANPQCIRVCPEKCYRKLRNGVVLHDPAKCDGCQSCTGACPFRVPQINPVTKKISKCNFCFNRIAKGLEPTCVAACISKALKIIDINPSLPRHYEKTPPSLPFITITNPSVRFVLPKEPRCSWVEKED